MLRLKFFSVHSQNLTGYVITVYLRKNRLKYITENLSRFRRSNEKNIQIISNFHAIFEII